MQEPRKSILYPECNTSVRPCNTIKDPRINGIRFSIPSIRRPPDGIRIWRKQEDRTASSNHQMIQIIDRFSSIGMRRQIWEWVGHIWSPLFAGHLMAHQILRKCVGVASRGVPRRPKASSCVQKTLSPPTYTYFTQKESLGTGCPIVFKYRSKLVTL